MIPRRTAVFCFTAGALVLTAALFAGPLVPPAGPVAPTPGPEPRIAINATNTPGDADSVFKITQSGSYYLTGNITGVAAKHGIEIAASGVTVDLNGFDLLGVPGSLDGVNSSVSALADIAVMNGSVRNWGNSGIDFSSPPAFNCSVHAIRASGNATDGIAVFFGSIITECLVYTNGGNGIVVNTGCTVTNCVARGNGLVGIASSSGSTISYCVSDGNLGSGIFGLSACSILHCTVRFNSLDGILCNSSCVIRGNTCHNNGNGAGSGAGIRAYGPGNRIESNNCTGADFGIKVDASANFIAANLCSGNTTNWSIVAGNRCLVVISASAAAINGNSGGVSPGSTDPNANFTY